MAFVCVSACVCVFEWEGEKERERERERDFITLTGEGEMSEGHTSLSSWSGMAADVWSKKASLGQRWPV